MRIVSLCPSLTELVFDLGRGADLVGRTRFCIHPAGLVDVVEKVGGTKNPKVARIVELAPDLVLLNEEENRREDADALAAAGLRCHTSLPKTALDTAAMVRSIGAAVEREAEAERIATDIERRSERVRAAAHGRPEVSWAYLIWRNPYMAVHPPMLYSGYVLWSIPFAFCVGALISRKLDASWIRTPRPNPSWAARSRVARRCQRPSIMWALP